MRYGAFGLVEVVGSSNAVIVIDQMLKTSDVSFLTWQTKCGGHATVFLTGDVSAVTAAVESVKGNPPCEIVASAVISNPSEETVRLAEEEATRNHFMLKLTGLTNGRRLARYLTGVHTSLSSLQHPHPSTLSHPGPPVLLCLLCVF